MILYKTIKGPVIEQDSRLYAIPETDWDTLFNQEDLDARLTEWARVLSPLPDSHLPEGLLPPIGSQEVWAAGVTYYRSRTARMDESRTSGGSDFYDRVYHAERPELFFKATPHRVVGHEEALHLRADSRWMVPEPELTVAVNRSGDIVGYTVGNDLSCRDIEGENPLYLPQAKVFQRCAAIGPGLLIGKEPLAGDTEIRLQILRAGKEVFQGATELTQMKRTPQELVSWLFQDNRFPQGCLLMTGTGIVPPDDVSLQSDDEIRITIPPIGTLVNRAGKGEAG